MTLEDRINTYTPQNKIEESIIDDILEIACGKFPNQDEYSDDQILGSIDVIIGTIHSDLHDGKDPKFNYMPIEIIQLIYRISQHASLEEPKYYYIASHGNWVGQGIKKRIPLLEGEISDNKDGCYTEIIHYTNSYKLFEDLKLNMSRFNILNLPPNINGDMIFLMGMGNLLESCLMALYQLKDIIYSKGDRITIIPFFVKCFKDIVNFEKEYGTGFQEIKDIVLSLVTFSSNQEIKMKKVETWLNIE